MRGGGVLHLIATLLLALAATMLLPLAIGMAQGGGQWVPFAQSIGVIGVIGLAVRVLTRRPDSALNVREGLLLVSTAWLCICFFGGLPFYFSHYFGGIDDAIFESSSAFTTTGATILENVDGVPMALQFWRHFAHWIGGMGIVLLGLAILPLLGTGGLSLYRAEFSGAKSEKLRPRIAETAMSLWKIYFALTVAQYALLRVAGMGSFDAICHAFSTLATGGFSTKTASIGAFHSPAIEWIVIVFMFLGGVNFTMHYRLWVERKAGKFFGDSEIRTYFGITMAASVLVTGSLLLDGHAGSFWDAVRTGIFQVTSILTTSGFATDDFERWAPFCQFILLGLMFIGGCTGSTAGGLKVARVLLLAKVVGREFKRMVERRGVFAIRLNGEAVPEQAIQSLLNLVYLTFIVNGVGCLALSVTGVDILTAISAVTACMFSIGPGLGSVGPAEHYGHLTAFAKCVLSLCMIAGRLEFYTLLVLLSPTFWRK